MPSKKPNIVFFHVDNLGMGELGCYGGGILRGADTRRIDQFASVPHLTENSQIGADLRVCANEEHRANFGQRS